MTSLMIGLTAAESPAGRALADLLRARGHSVLPIPLEPGRLPGVDVLVLLGSPDADYARRLLDRRADLDRPPRLVTLEGAEDALAAIEGGPHLMESMASPSARPMRQNVRTLPR